MCLYVHTICEYRFGGCKRTFSWLDQKIKDRHALRIFVTVIYFGPTGAVHLLSAMVRHSHGSRIIVKDN